MSEAWLILFEDGEMRPEVFTGPECEEAAKTRYTSLNVNWNITLFRAVAWWPAPETVPPTSRQTPLDSETSEEGKE